MARVLVSDAEDGRETPFLRGILTHSLQESGLGFDEAYQLASEIRRDLLARGRANDNAETVTVTSRVLRAEVMRQLRRRGNVAVLRRYRSRREAAPALLVRGRNGQRTPFSRGRHLRALESCGLARDEARGITTALYASLLAHGEPVVDSVHIDRLSHEHLRATLGDAVARRYLVWRDFVLSGRPLLLLIGGTAGSGKSTTATAVANRLEIVRTQSTDMLREVMRMMVPKRLLPVLHRSSFNAWQALPSVRNADSEDAVVEGYRAQAELVSVACEAVMQRALRERVSLILEGVHVGPALLEHVPDAGDALVVPVMIAVLDQEVLKSRIRGRGSKVAGRRAARYLAEFDAIWELQKHLLSSADKAGIPIVSNTDEERVFREIMRILIDRLAEDFHGEASEVFRADRTDTTTSSARTGKG